MNNQLKGMLLYSWQHPGFISVELCSIECARVS
jgi:hypothetical protein